jgi:geranylgeranyl reductase family protein
MMPTSLESLGREVGQLARWPGDHSVWDVAVIGAGPAGATLAAHVASLGRRVLLFDRESFPREKVCGDGLIPDALGALERLGIMDEVAAAGHRASRVTVWSPSRIAVDVPGTFVTIKRVDLDALIAREAVRRGAVFVRARVVRLEPRGTDAVAVHLADGPGPVQARLAVLATGADLSLARAADPTVEDRPSAIALRCYVRSRATIDDLVVSYDRAILPGYAWIFPLGGGEYNVGCGLFYRSRRHGRVNLRDTFEAFTRNFPPAVELMAKAESTTPLRGARLRCSLDWLSLAARPPVVAVGETLGATFPFTGEGIGKAMETAEIAAATIGRALDRDDLSLLHLLPLEIERALKPRYLGYERAESWMSYQWVADQLARLARRRAIIRRAAAGILNETVDPRAVFSLRGLLTALFR